MKRAFRTLILLSFALPVLGIAGWKGYLALGMGPYRCDVLDELIIRDVPSGRWEAGSLTETLIRAKSARLSDVDRLRGLCRAGDGEACERLVFTASRYVARPPDAGGRLTSCARDAWERACDRGDGIACAQWATSERVSANTGRPDAGEHGRRHRELVAKAEPLLRTTCGAGNGEACRELANLPGVEGGPEAFGFMEKACAAKDAFGCEQLGEWLDQGESERAIAAFRQACELGASGGCYELVQRNVDRTANLERYCRAWPESEICATPAR